MYSPVSWIILAVVLVYPAYTLMVVAMLQRALKAYHQGRPSQAISWARYALMLRPTVVMRATAHHVLGLGYTSQGEFAQAAQHYGEAHALATKARNPDVAARSLTLLGSLQKRQGALEEAARTMEQAAQMSLKSRRDALVGYGECLLAMGRIDEARQVFYQARTSPGLAQPQFERRSQGGLALGLSWIEGEANNPGPAWQYVEEATAAFAGMPKVTLMADATATWILALLGRRAEALEKIQSVQALAASLSADRDSQLTALTMAGRALFVLGECDRSKALWQQYLNMDPDPVWKPRGWYFLGECCLCLNDADSARDAFQQAVDLGISTDYARRAQFRLQQLTSTTSTQG
jgi:tetratricopeptide (TPR) repeat protein